MNSALLLEVTRGPLVEELHRGHLAVVSHDRTTVASLGQPAEARTYWRSAAKPFQTMALLYTGAADRFGLDGEDLATCSASHNAEPFHLERVRAVLDKAGCSPADLACGAHPPLDPGSAAALARAGEPPSALHNNCSGKHAGMLALAKHLGASTHGYREPEDPVQREMLANVMRFTGLAADEIALGVDGCGVVTFGLSVEVMAFAFARLMRPDAIESPYREAAFAVREAMIRHPHLVAGTKRLDSDLMRRAAGRILSKGGASGVLCAAISGGVGVAIKLESGPRLPGLGGPVLIETLRQLGALDEADVDALAAYAHPPVQNVSGTRVGEMRTTFTLDLHAPAVA